MLRTPLDHGPVRRIRVSQALVIGVIGFATMALHSPSAAAQGAGDSADVAGILAQLTAVARSSNLELRSRRRAVEAARALDRATGHAPAASAALSLSDGPKLTPAAGNAALTVSREIFLGARLEAARARASVERIAAEQDLAARERLLSSQVLALLAGAASQMRLERRLKRSDRLLEEAETALRARFEVGSARYVDVLRVRTARLEANVQLSTARAERVAAASALTQFIGTADATTVLRLLDSAASDALSASWLTALPVPQAADTALALHAEVRAARSDVARAVAASRELEVLRRLQLAALAGLQRIGPANGGSGASLLLGLSSTLPFTARRSNALAAEASAEAVGASQAEVVAVEAAARAELLQNSARYSAARERLQTFDEALLLAADAEREAALASFRAGTLTLLELLDFEQALVGVEVERARSLAAAAEANLARFGSLNERSGRP